MLSHWIRVELDETTGAVTARHFCAASYGPKGKERDAIVHQDVALPAPVAEGLERALGGVINANRAGVEKEARKARAAADLVAETRNEFDDKPAHGAKAPATKEPAA